MKILLVHNFYQQPGGEDEVFRTEFDLLVSRGHTVRQFTVHNDDCDDMSRVALAGATIWNKKMGEELRELVRSEGFQVVHFHNTFPLISPAAYSAVREEGAAVVQTLHNFRLLCPNALLFREGQPCEDCIGGLVPWRAVTRKCYRGEVQASAVVATQLTIHRLRRTWHSDIDAFIATTEFAREKFVNSGLPADKITTKPNFLHPDPDVGSGDGDYAIFIGRLSQEKGVRPLLEAWTNFGIPMPLKIIGDGPLADEVRKAKQICERITWLGRRPLEEVYHHLGKAKVLIFPSECYETFGRVAIEAFAKGTPVIASNHGAMADVVEHNRTGLLFEPGDACDLALKVQLLLSQPHVMTRMRREVREEFERNYTGQRAYEQLMSVYRQALAARHPLMGLLPVLVPQVAT